MRLNAPSHPCWAVRTAHAGLDESKTAGKTLVRRYYLSMLSLAVVVLALATVSISIPGHLHHLRDLILGTGIVLVVLNLIGARILFSPIARYLDGRVNFEIARPRIRKLPIVSAGWAFLVVFVHMYLQFFFHHVRYVRNAPNLFELLIYPVTLLVIFGAFMGLFIYFFIGDYTARLREEIFHRHRMVIEPGPTWPWCAASDESVVPCADASSALS